MLTQYITAIGKSRKCYRQSTLKRYRKHHSISFERTAYYQNSMPSFTQKTSCQYKKGRGLVYSALSLVLLSRNCHNFLCQKNWWHSQETVNAHHPLTRWTRLQNASKGDNEMQINVCTRMLTARLFTVPKLWKQCKHPTKRQRLSKLRCTINRMRL